MASILCVGAASWDIVLKVNTIPSTPTKVLADDCVETSAGMATSAAMSVVALGGEANICARIGDDDNAQRWLAGVRRRGVSTSLVEGVQGARTGVSAIIVDACGERLIVPYYDPALRHEPPRITAAQIAKFDAVLVDTRWPEASKHVLNCAQANGRLAVLDADIAARDILEELLPLATHVIFSSEALASLCDAPSVETQLALAARQTTAIVGVTQGAAGCTLRIDGQPVHLPAPRVNAVDTLAAGDVFHGAFTLGIAEGETPVAAARFANAAAALKCERFGGIAGVPTRIEVQARFSG